jgi:two-component system OmpR family sensor kinase
MKIFKSIKWRLQLWYGLILVLVLAGFGFTAYQLEWGRQMRRIDDELQRRIGVIAAGLRPPPPHAPDFGGQPFGFPPPDQPLDEEPPGQNPRPPVDFHLPPPSAHLFDTNDPNGFYFVVQSRDDTEIARGGNVPRLASASLAKVYKSLRKAGPISPEPTANPPELPPAQMLPQVVIVIHSAANPLNLLPTRAFLAFREIVQILPSGAGVLVGCSVAPQLTELRRTALELAAVGAGILLLGLVGGRWLVERALRPIDGISAAAAKISAGDLSQRINVAETESELGRLAGVLNSTFARLETAFAQQQQFTADAAHELRTPVSVILTQTQTALTRERTAAEYRETIEACQRASQRMRRLMESLLELARLDAGQESLKRVRFNFSKMIADAIESVRPLAEERGVKILPELGSLEITGDSERLAQVIANLLANAIQYNPSGGEVRLKLESPPGLAMLTVADTGPGISNQDLPHVFERFYRGDKSRTASNGNAGLGLAIAKAIVEAHGGTMEVASQTGTGTTFTVRLPAT